MKDILEFDDNNNEDSLEVNASENKIDLQSIKHCLTGEIYDGTLTFFKKKTF